MADKKFKILSIDDDPGCQKVMTRFMTVIGGYAVETAYTGTEGLEKAASLEPDLIILDMYLPDMSGMDVMDRLSAEPATSRIPVIIVTGALLDARQLENLRLRKNFVRLEEKPTGMSALLKVVDMIQSSETAPGLMSLSDRTV